MWDGWPISRIILLFSALALFLIFVQVTLLHYRQNFRHWAMWAPVLGTPIIGMLLLTLVFYNIPWLRAITGIFCAAGVLSGLVGFGLHVEGVGERVDGYRMQNFLVGPPVILPLMVAAISVLGLIALYWR
ncbi:hypothetical protein JCM14036_08330 [Desulfotomaculum defluvii]